MVDRAATTEKTALTDPDSALPLELARSQALGHFLGPGQWLSSTLLVLSAYLDRYAFHKNVMCLCCVPGTEVRATGTTGALCPEGTYSPVERDRCKSKYHKRKSMTISPGAMHGGVGHRRLTQWFASCAEGCTGIGFACYLLAPLEATCSAPADLGELCL